MLYQPTGRPIAEPPIFDYEELVEDTKIPSDARLKRLFKKNIAMGYRFRDALTESALLWKYEGWACDIYELEVDEERKEFYSNLRIDNFLARHEVEDARRILIQAMDADVISELGLWEYINLDDDGGTMKVQQQLEKRSNPFQDFDYWLIKYRGTPAFQKYGHLAPPDFYDELKKLYCPITETGGKKEMQLELDTTILSNNSPYASAIDSPSRPDDKLSGEQRLATENAALKKRIAQLELESETAKKQKGEQG